MNIEKKANNQNQVSQVVSTPLPHREGQRSGSPVIKLKEINKIYRTDEVETQALENVNLEVRKGEFLSIMGPSGCGKSTLLNIMGLLDEPTSGQIELCGQVIDPKMSDNRLAELRNKTLGFVFQSFHLIPTLNVIDNVMLPLIYRGVRSSERIRLAKEVIERVGLSHRMKHRHGTAAQTEQGGRPHHRHGDPQRAAGPADRPHHQVPRRAADTVKTHPRPLPHREGSGYLQE